MNGTPFTDPTCPWAQYELGHLLTCEERLCAWVRQPMNTYSNLVIFFVAVLLLAKAIQFKRGTDRDFGILATLIGISSTLAHASQIRSMVFLDYAAQFVLFAYLISLNLSRLRNLGSRWQWTLGLGILFVTPGLVDKRAGVPVFALLASVYLFTEYLGYRLDRAKDYSALKKSLAIFIVASCCFVLDSTGIVCAPTRHFFQLHAVWHALVAFSLYQLAIYCRQFEVGLAPAVTEAAQ